MKGFGALFTASLFAVFKVVSASNVLDLTPETFDAIVLDSGRPALVEFFAPWCGHCKSLAPTYEQLADEFAGKPVVIAKVDADKHKSLGKRFGVKGFPTLKWFDGKSANPIDYKSGRDLDSLTAFVADNSGVAIKPKKEEPSDVTVLNDANFDAIVNGQKNVLVKFYAPWCGHCKNLAPIWEKVATDFIRDEDVIIAKLDAENTGAKDTADKYKIAGYPTLKFFPKGSSEPIDFEGGRTEADIVKFVNQHAGTHRVPGGGLDASAGRIEALDAIVEKFTSLTTPSLPEMLAAVKKAAEALADPYAAYYVKAIEKTIKKSDYAATELKRLEKVASKGNLAPEKADDITIRQNILGQFLGEKKPSDVPVKDEL